jgi:hypothetical protein
LAAQVLERLFDRWREEASGALGRAAIALAAAIARAVAVAFLCAALFVAVLERYGFVDACHADAAFFLVVALLLLIAYALATTVRRKELVRARALSESETPTLVTDPRFVLAGLQIVEPVGLRRVLPIVALGGAAFARASRPRTVRSGARSNPSARPPAIRRRRAPKSEG